MRRALEVYKETFPQIEAILVGTRRGDPHGGELHTDKEYVIIYANEFDISNTLLSQHD